MKWFNGLRKEYQVALVMLPILVAFYILNCYIVYTSDDIAYQFIFTYKGWHQPNSVEITSFREVLQSQYIHYLVINGRAVVHTIVQSAVSLWGKPVFNVLNTLMFGLFTFLTVALVDRKLLKNYMAWGMVAVCVAMFLTGHQSFYYNVSHSVNYLWGLTFCLLFLYIWRYYEFKKWIYTIPLFVLSFFLGWSQELFALPIAGAICIYYLVHRKEIFTQRCLISFAFCCGVLVLVMAPGNFRRMGDNFDIVKQLESIYKGLTTYLRPIATLFIFSGIYLIFSRKKKSIWSVLKANELYLYIFILSLMLCFVFPVVGMRVFQSVGFWLMILMSVVLVARLQYRRIYKYIFIGAYIFSITMTGFVCHYSYINGRYQDKIIEKFVESDNGNVFVERPKFPKTFRSSLRGITWPSGLKAIRMRYSNMSKPLTCYDFEFESLEELFSEENRAIEGLDIYKTGTLGIYVTPNRELSGSKFKYSYTRKTHKWELWDKILVKLNPGHFATRTSKWTKPKFKFIKVGDQEIGMIKVKTEDFKGRQLSSIRNDKKK